MKYLLITSLIFSVLFLTSAVGNYDDKLHNGSQPDTVSVKKWELRPFVRFEDNPILGPDFNSQFLCPVTDKTVRWEGRAIVGASAVVRNNMVHLLYDAEDLSKGFQLNSDGTPGTIRTGLAVGEDGTHFKTSAKPVLYPKKDSLLSQEWPGGCQITRMVEGPDKTYFLYYAAYDGKVSRIFVATSRDLINWKKHGNIFSARHGKKYENLWAKSPAIVTAVQNGRLIATRMNGKYWMYWGESLAKGINISWSDNLIDWNMLEDEKGKPLIILKERPGYFDNSNIEGGVAMLTKNGIVLLYNSFRIRPEGNPDGKGRCSFSGMGQALFDPNEPTKLLDRCNNTFLYAEKEYEVNGSVNNVTFLTGMIYFKNKLFLYFNGGDRVVSAAHFNYNLKQ